MSDKLKPCPFCGKWAHTGHQVSKNKDDEYYLVMCAYCFARTVGETLNEAITAWNNRVPATDQFPVIGKMVTMPPEYKVNPNYQNLGKNHFCASCGVMFIDWENAPTNYCGNCGQKLREVSHG